LKAILLDIKDVVFGNFQIELCCKTIRGDLQ
jgi:hypothetical protein